MTAVRLAGLDDAAEVVEQDDLFSALEPAPVEDAESETLTDTSAYALPVGLRPILTIKPRVYQSEAIVSWLRQDGRGVVVLPTGAGKTVVALMAIERLAVRTLVVVPTIELLTQWRAGIIERLGLTEEQVGIVGGGQRLVRDITVITFDSAAMPNRRLDGFGLLIVDEA
ncbi:MAG TPA: DEAD/DEAH box helicase family protein, partial [Thermomicrobiales bacterium]